MIITQPNKDEIEQGAKQALVTYYFNLYKKEEQNQAVKDYLKSRILHHTNDEILIRFLNK